MLTTHDSIGIVWSMKKRPQTALDDGSTPESVAAVLTVRLGNTLNLEVDEFFRPWGLTALQFNILRILYVRDPERKGVSRGALQALLIHRVPDVTRLLDRLVAAGLIARHRPKDDQRTSLATLTNEGWDLVEKTHRSLLEMNRAQFGHLNKTELKQFIGLLRKALDRTSKKTATE